MYRRPPSSTLLPYTTLFLTVGPDEALAPVIPPVIVPIVQLKLLATLAVKLMLGPVPLQIVFALAVVTIGVGFTVTVIVYGAPGHDPVVEVGVTIYSTVPAVILLGLVSV